MRVDAGSILSLSLFLFSGAFNSAHCLPGLIRKANRVHKQNKGLIEDEVVVMMVMVVSSLALYSVPSLPLSMYINTDDVCHRRKQKTEASGPCLR